MAENNGSEKLEVLKPDTKEKRTALRILWGQIRRTDRSLHSTDKVHFLKRIPFFEHLKRNQLEQVAKIVYERDYLENEYLFEFGQPGAALFIIHSGEISIEIPTGENVPSQIAVLGKSTFIGELALLDEAKRSASARALEPTKVYALFRKDLDQLAVQHPDISSEIYKSLATIVGNRLKATNELFKFATKKAAA